MNLIRSIRQPHSRKLVLRGYTWSTNCLLFQCTVASAGLYVLADGFLPRLLMALVLSISCGPVGISLLQALLGLPGLVRQNVIVRRARPAESPDLLRECRDLAIAMRVRLRGPHPVKVADGWRNAGAMAGNIIVGTPIVEEFNVEARKGVLAHEVGHIRGRHSAKQSIAMASAYGMLALFLSSAQFPLIVDVLVLFSGMALSMSKVSWACEFDADAVAARYVGSGTMISALRALSGDDDESRRRDTWSHPSMARRIARLQTLGG